MRYTIQELAGMAQGRLLNAETNGAVIEHILLDSRQIAFPASSLFVALVGRHFDGHTFLENALKSGVRNFLTARKPDPGSLPGANVVLVDDTLRAFQQIALQHRRRFGGPVIGITGSNGKTIVKEWLFQLLQPDRHIARSPKSYNSQTGVPLSLLQLDRSHDLGIFEAGISQMGEMQRIAPIVAPTIGIFTMLGDAHSEGFPDKATKLQEKLLLFSNAEFLVYCCDDDLVASGITEWKSRTSNPIRLLSWSAKNKPAAFQTTQITRSSSGTTVQLCSGPGPNRVSYTSFTIPFTDDASIENAIHCWMLMQHIGYDGATIAERMARLEPVAMRLELKEGTNGCTIINDSYNSDLSALGIALDFLKQQSKTKAHTLILSDILQSGRPSGELYQTVAGLIREKKIDRLIGIGQAVGMLDGLLPAHFNKTFFENTGQFLEKLSPDDFQAETILLKGARQFHFEKIANHLASKVHQTVLEVNLTSLLNNLRAYQKQLLPGTRLMVMVKAGAYGSGSAEVAKLLEFQQVDYLAVAYTDEGVELRKAGIQLPILVLNPEEVTFDHLARHHLEPELYNFLLLEKYLRFLRRLAPGLPRSVHLKLDTGMHRLGFEKKDLTALLAILKKNKDLIVVKSVFSHLAASENPSHDAFTESQVALFRSMSERITKALGYRPLRHILNSGGIVRFPAHQMDMVRLGIGLYGIDESGLLQPQLLTVNTLKATISQIKTIGKKETIGYGRMGRAAEKTRIATLSIGYADGLLRKAGNGRYSVLIRGQKAPLIGNICMDMAMCDITAIPGAREGDEAIIFGNGPDGTSLPVQELAQCLGTIPYEVFTAVSGRVKRVYVQE